MRFPTRAEPGRRPGRPRSVWLVVFLGVAAGLAQGCGDADVPWSSPVAFDTATAWVHTGADSARLLVEVARTPEQREYGLMRRPSLDAGSGMIFFFDTVQADSTGFWMWRTEIPLDIAYLDSAGTIRAIGSMEPCESWAPEGCPVYRAGVEYSRVLEVNRSWFDRHGVEVGDAVRIVR